MTMLDKKDTVLRYRIMSLTIAYILAVCISQVKSLDDANSEEIDQPTVLIAMLVRNKAHVLPYTLYYLENLDYPKDRITLWIQSDHNIDNSVEVVEAWLQSVDKLYRATTFIGVTDSDVSDFDEFGPFHWTEQRHQYISKKRQEAMDYARGLNMDYIFMLDSDVMLINPITLSQMILEQRIVVAPKLSNSGLARYSPLSNFWSESDEEGNDRIGHLAIVSGDAIGCHNVFMVHSAVLINLGRPRSTFLAFDPPPPEYSGPPNDYQIFAHNAQKNNIPLFVSNRVFYGFMVTPMEEGDRMEEERDLFIYTKSDIMMYDEPLEKLDYIHAEPTVNNFGLDQVCVVITTPKQKYKIMNAIRDLGMEANIKAVDDRSLNREYLKENGIKELTLADEELQPLDMDEISTFLGHYQVWNEVIEENYSQVMVLENDVNFKPHFRTTIMMLLQELKETGLAWDFIYLHRTVDSPDDTDKYVDGTHTLVWPQFSNGAVGYLLSNSGAKKLVAQEPLKKLVTFDEYINIMADKFPMKEWKINFSPRDLVTMSAYAPLVWPTSRKMTGHQFTGPKDIPVKFVDEL